MLGQALQWREQSCWRFCSALRMGCRSRAVIDSDSASGADRTGQHLDARIQELKWSDVRLRTRAPRRRFLSVRHAGRGK